MPVEIQSSLISSAVTILVGLIALLVYKKGRNDAKKDAARTIVLELKNAHQHLLVAKDSIVKDGLIREDVFLLRSSQWEKHKYLFARDLTSDELGDLDLFYEKCRLYDDVARYNSTYFVKNEEHIRANLQATLADYTKSYLSELKNGNMTPDDATNEYKSLLRVFADQFMEEVTSSSSPYFYRPKKTFSEAKALVYTITPNVTDSRAYERLQDISNQTLRTKFFDWLGRHKERM